MEKKENSYLLPIVGAFIGGLIATFPWILCYVYANMMYSLLTIIVAMGAFKGYQIMKGKISKKVPILIAIISFICISLATLVIIPHLLLIKETGSTSMEAFNLLYSFPEFKSGIMHDYIFTILFTILGVSGVVTNIKNQIDSGSAEISLSGNVLVPSGEELDEIKNFFKGRGAINKHTTVDKNTIEEVFKDKKETLIYLISRNIIVKKRGGYYYSIENESDPNKHAYKSFFIAFGITILVIIITFIILALI